MQKTNLVFFGPQGAGKGTQAEMLSEELNIPRISPGDIYRREIAKKTILGKEAESYVNQGVLAPDRLTNKMMVKRLKRKDVLNGFIFDGYPRNIEQISAMEKMAKINGAVMIKISDQEAIKRLADRRICACGESYHLKFKPSKKKGICDECGGKLTRRDDESPKKVKTRLEIYHQKTEEVIKYFRQKGVLIVINGEQSIKKVHQDILKKLKAKKLI